MVVGCGVMGCRGGHGRTGTVAACLLGRLYGLDAVTSLSRVQLSHCARTSGGAHSSPETLPQYAQVARLLKAYKAVATAGTAISVLKSAPLDWKEVTALVLTHMLLLHNTADVLCWRWIWIGECHSRAADCESCFNHETPHPLK